MSDLEEYVRRGKRVAEEERADEVLRLAERERRERVMEQTNWIILIVASLGLVVNVARLFV